MKNHAESFSNEAKIQPYSIYIHVPFCKQACSYCDFYFVTRQQLIPDYVEALLKDISTSASDFTEALSVTGLSPRLESIYFGGGTPSRLPVADIERIMQAIERHHGAQHLKEVTIETNPDDVNNASYLRGLKNAGITRLSMGIQSFDPDLLKFMNRAHSSEEARRSLEFIQQTEFDSYTVDLIYGNPGQTLGQLENDINTFLSFNPPHISAYALTIEPGTRLGKYAELGRLTEADDSDVAAHMKLVSEMLGEHGLKRYEVSNFAREGHEAVHNSSYWEHVPYLGIGPGAHAFMHSNVAQRWETESDLAAYIRNAELKSQPKFNLETLDELALAEERLMMGLRTRKGVSSSTLVSKYDYTLNTSQLNYINRLADENLIELQHNDIMRLTENGYATADRITLEIISRH